MTLKYESEILFDLMKRDGDDTPSDVSPYESELKEKYLNQVVGAYPKLQDYRPEWLSYNLYHHIPSEFPVESVTNVTNASFHDVVPYAYKSAILKGQTLVNLVGEKREYINVGAKLYGWEFMLPYNLTNGKNYLAIFDVSGTIDESTSRVYLMDYGFDSGTGNTSSPIPTFRLGHNVVKCHATCDDHRVLKIRTTRTENETFTLSNVMLIEYQDGMENWDIPYFEGMKSVQMPVLKATGKNLLDTTSMWFDGYSANSTKIKKSTLTKSLISKVKPNTTYTFTRTQLTNRCVISSFKGNHEDLPITKELYNDGLVTVTENPVQFTTLDDTEYVIIYVHNETATPNGWVEHGIYQLEEGSTATSYEPYKSNILTVNEEVELRGIGDVKDELNLLTGELTTRTREVVYNSTDIIVGKFPNKENTFNLFFDDKSANTRSIMVDKIPVVTGWSSFLSNFDLSCTSLLSDYIYVTIPNVNTPEEAKTYLLNLNPTFLYILAEESVKTVDLSTTIRPIEGTMHVNTSSQTLPPLLDMSVPVEATTQNLMSFANIVEEE